MTDILTLMSGPMTREQKLELALKMARSWMHCVEPRLLDTPNFRRDMEPLDAALSAPKAEAEEPCPVCAKPFSAGDTCATDIELGKCHAECLAGSPTVDLKTGEPMDGPIDTFPHVAPKVEADAWLHPTANWADCDWKVVRRHCMNDGPYPIPLYTSPVPALTDEDETERRLDRVAAPDNGTAPEVLAAILECAHAWVPEVRIIGNVRAGDIARAVEAALAAFHVPAITDQAIELTYRNWRGEVSTRRLSPERIWYGSTEWHPEPQWLLRAYDHEKQAHRDFALKDFGVLALTDKAVERVARAWASIDGNLVEFEDERKSGCSLIEEDTGTYEGYMSEAAELLRRSGLLAAFPHKGEAA